MNPGNVKTIFLLLLFGILSNNICAQTTKPETHQAVLSKFYLGLGGGPGFESYVVGVSGTLILPNNFGSSISYKSNGFEAKNIPSNYHSGLCFWGDCTPDDWINILSVKLLKESPSTAKRVRLGIEGGPSWVNYHITTFTPNPNSGWFGSNYETSHTNKNSIGISLRAKMEFPLTRYVGFELAVFSNINKFHSFLGLELYLTMGLVRD